MSESYGGNSLDIQREGNDGFGLNKAARLDNQRQREQYSPRFELQLNPTFPYRLIPLDPETFIKVSSERLIP